MRTLTAGSATRSAGWDGQPALVHCDVLVVGLGPAGAAAARMAAANGARVLAIDRKAEPGEPVQCAEFVPAMIGQDKVIMGRALRQSIVSMTTFVEREGPHHRDNFPGHMIDRRAFDAALVEDAVQAGAECRFSSPVRAIDECGRVTLADTKTIDARVIIGADGPRSVVGKAVGRINAEIAETRQIRVPLLQPSDATDIFLSAEIPGGYAWLFPKGEHANLGLGVAPPWRARLKPLLAGLHDRLVDEGRVGRQVLAHTGGAIPVGGAVDPVAELGGVTVLLAGDAAGLTNPVTGAGINAAVQSGALAGLAGARIVAGDRQAAAAYAEDIDDTFGASIARALARRRAMMDTYADAGRPSGADMRRGWIAFAEYWAA
jgi:geranylgeranyl reductase family protein